MFCVEIPSTTAVNKCEIHILHYGQMSSEFGSHSTMAQILLGSVLKNSKVIPELSPLWTRQNLAHCVPETGHPAIPLKFEHQLMIMESHSGRTSHLWRPWGSSSLLVNARL